MGVGRETQSTQWRVKTLAAANKNTAKHLSDQNVYAFGQNHISHIRGKIGNNGKPFEILYNEYLEGL